MNIYPHIYVRIDDMETSLRRQRWFNVAVLMLLIFLITWNVAKGQSPASELQVAVADLETRVPVLLAPTTRYLTLYTIPEDRRAEAAAVVSFVLNSVSRAPVIVRPVVVPETGGRVLRINLADYGLDGDLWELLAQEDPYWHIQTLAASGSIELRRSAHQQSSPQAVVFEGVIQDLLSAKLDNRNRSYREVYTDGGWLNLESAARLRALSGSGGAILRGDFFVARVSTTIDGGHYYSFAGIPEKESDWFELLGLDVETIRELQAEEGANLIRSGITQKFRRIKRRQGPLGAVWKTYDVARNTPERDPLRNPFAFTYDAGEQIAAKANGLHLFALYNSKGNRQDFVPPEIVAGDTSDPHARSPVAPLISCVRCHVEDGLRPFGNDQRRLLAGAVELFVENPADAQRLAAFYERDTARKLERDREDYLSAAEKATGGLDAVATSRSLARTFADYSDVLVTPIRAAAELGIEPQALKPTLSPSHDPIILALLEGIEVAREQWAASFAEAATLAATRGR